MSDLTQESLVGTWRLIDMEVKWRTRPVHIYAEGTLVYTSQGDVSVVMEISRSRRCRLRKAVAYTGRYHVEGKETVHQLTNCTWPFNPKKQLRRRAQILPDQRLRLVPVRKGNTVTCALTWKLADTRP
ncbi:lipocalin-like domain-containing protein [Streptomyces lavendofoliae]|uniref:lipocalin-like domain-containing protein n=1 Tax=Streptomyces lavendofoliae TaxID=67314 RepID=UPI00300EEDA9